VRIDDIAFLLHQAHDFSNIEALSVIDDGGEVRIEGWKTPLPAKEISVTLYTPAWEADLMRLASPRYPSMITSGADFTLELEVEYHPRALTSVQLQELALILTHQVVALAPRSGSVLGFRSRVACGFFRDLMRKGLLPDERVTKRTVPFTVLLGGTALSSEPIYGGKLASLAYIGPTETDRDSHFAAGKVTVAATLSNLVNLIFDFGSR
jgi:hypothetical protein